MNRNRKSNITVLFFIRVENTKFQFSYEMNRNQ